MPRCYGALNCTSARSARDEKMGHQIGLSTKEGLN